MPQYYCIVVFSVVLATPYLRHPQLVTSKEFEGDTLFLDVNNYFEFLA